MNIWLIVVGEPLPIDEEGARLYRKGLLAEILVERGHGVVVWSSTTNHTLKTKRANETTSIAVNPKHEIVLLDAPTYKNNISVQRIWYNYKTAKEFKKVAAKYDRPDIIVCSYPPIDLAVAAVEYGTENDVPVILDIRDLWPDIITTNVPPFLKPFAKLGSIIMNRQAKRGLQGAAAITGITEDFVSWGFEKASRTRKENDNRAFLLSYSDQRPDDTAILEAERFWDEKGVIGGQGQFVACMMGNLALRTAEIDVLVKAASHIPEDVRDVFRIVICGTGMAFDYLSSLAKNIPQVLLPGWMNRAQIWTLLRRSSVGVLPYLSRNGFEKSIPNKVGEYLSAGLPILSSIHGEVSRLLESQQCGFTYPNGDPKSLATLMVHLSNEPKLREKMARRSRQVFRQNFRAETVYGQYGDFIESTVLLRRAEQ